MQKRIDRTPEEDYKLMILTILYMAKSSRQALDVVERVKMILEANNILKPLDHMYLVSNQPRYYNTCCWARKQLKDDGYLRQDSARGQWELSNKGKKYMESMIKSPRLLKLLLTWHENHRATQKPN